MYSTKDVEYNKVFFVVVAASGYGLGKAIEGLF